VNLADKGEQMSSRNVIRVNKVRDVKNERYVILLLNSAGAIVWVSSELDKEAAITQLLAIGLPVSRIPQKFEEA
jgi:hypothetical protein